MHCSKSFRRTVLVAILSAFLPVSVYAAEVTLGWDAPDDSRVTGYHVYYGTSGTEYKNAPRMTIGSAAQTSTRIASLEEGKTYVFAMTSIDATGNESEFSESVSKTIPYLDSDNDGTPDQSDLCPNDPDKNAPGACGCGTPDTDTDGDGIADCNDTDDPVVTAPDADGDGVPDTADLCPNDPNKSDPGACGCGTPDTDTDGDGIADCNDTDDPVVTDPPEVPVNLAPEAPILLSPPDSAVDMKRKFTLETGDFADPDNGIHAATEWQISTRTDFSEPVLGIKNEKNLTRLPVANVVFVENETYYWRARYFDDGGAQSAWSAVNEFTTGIWGRDKNNNGISDASETRVATDLDGNGITDSAQDDIKSIQVLSADRQIALKYSEPNAIEYIEGIDPLLVEDQSGMPDSVPFDLVNFRIKVDEPGQTAVVTFYLSEPAPKGARWFKYDDVDGWQDYSRLAAFAPNRKSVQIVLTDGGIGDADGVENGVIIDPSGVGVKTDSDGGGGGGGCFINSLF